MGAGNCPPLLKNLNLGIAKHLLVIKSVLTNIFGNMISRILSRLSRPMMANIRRNMGNEPAPVGKLAKPSGFKGPMGVQMVRHLGITLVLATYLTWHWYYFYVLPRQQAYDEFYANFDARKMFERQKSKGVFQSIQEIEEAEAEEGDEEEEDEE